MIVKRRKVSAIIYGLGPQQHPCVFFQHAQLELLSANGANSHVVLTGSDSDGCLGGLSSHNSPVTGISIGVERLPGSSFGSQEIQHCPLCLRSYDKCHIEVPIGLTSFGYSENLNLGFEPVNSKTTGIPTSIAQFSLRCLQGFALIM